MVLPSLYSYRAFVGPQLMKNVKQKRMKMPSKDFLKSERKLGFLNPSLLSFWFPCVLDSTDLLRLLWPQEVQRATKTLTLEAAQ
eukprot:5332663-Amphidinium_carterae.1